MERNFMDAMKDTLNEKYNKSVTENGAVEYRTTGKELLDINFLISSLRNSSEEDVETRFSRAYYENKLLAIKWLFYAGDVRSGIGERRLFRIGMKYLANYHKEVAKALLPLIPEYTRWDNILPLLDTPLRKNVLRLIDKQFYEDICNYQKELPISLLAKWLPSANASSSETKRYAKIIISNSGLTDREYRKTLSALRSYLNVVEVNMSKKEWNKIDYSKVPSRANLIYKNAFLQHDATRRNEYLSKLVRGETKINASVLFPHDVVHNYPNNKYTFTYAITEDDITSEELWKALPDYVNGDDTTICVADGSGSMTCGIQNGSTVMCLDVAISLAIYFSERCKGQFKDKYITFSNHPEFVDFSNCNSLREKIMTAAEHSEVADTNIEAVFDLILDTAIENNMNQEDLPKNILILSDMEFNECAVSNDDDLDKKLFEVISEKYEKAGYKLPRLVFWNISSRSKTIPVRENDLGVSLVSGYSPVIAKMVLSNKTDPYECLLEQLNSERYDEVQKAVKKISLNIK